jgi:dephospho-CoA kinase
MDPLQLLKTHGIALTGGIATGKSTVAKIIADHGFQVLDADVLAREVVAPGSSCLEKIVGEFGSQVRCHDGTLDRQKMRSIVFSDAQALARLESIMHPEIERLLMSKLQNPEFAAAPGPFFYEASLIFERNRQNQFAAVWVTWCPPEVQLARLMARDGISEESAQSILSKQMSADQKRQMADQVILTHQPLNVMKEKIEKLLKGLKSPYNTPTST